MATQKGTIRAPLSIVTDTLTGDLVATYTHPGSAAPGELLSIRVSGVNDANVADRFCLFEWFAGIGIDVPVALGIATNALVASDVWTTYFIENLGELESRLLAGDVLQAGNMGRVIVYPDDTIRIRLENTQAADALSNGFAVLALDSAYGERL